MKQLAGKNLVLIGMMGTGKTEVGKRLAAKLGWCLADTDELLKQRAGQSITEIFRCHGEPYFRGLERELIRELAKRRGLVIATGGGVVLNAENIADLRAGGILVWLEAKTETLFARLQGDESRPLFGCEADLTALLCAREPLYRDAAQLRVDTTGRTVLQVAEEILRILAGG
jgi:shikimate kinase